MELLSWLYVMIAINNCNSMTDCRQAFVKDVLRCHYQVTQWNYQVAQWHYQVAQWHYQLAQWYGLLYTTPARMEINVDALGAKYPALCFPIALAHNLIHSTRKHLIMNMTRMWKIMPMTANQMILKHRLFELQFIIICNHAHPLIVYLSLMLYN